MFRNPTADVTAIEPKNKPRLVVVIVIAIIIAVISFDIVGMESQYDVIVSPSADMKPEARV